MDRRRESMIHFSLFKYVFINVLTAKVLNIKPAQQLKYNIKQCRQKQNGQKQPAKTNMPNVS
jgi:hypothetical protein